MTAEGRGPDRRRRLSVDVVLHLKNGCFLIIVKKKVDVSHMTDRLTMIKGIVLLLQFQFFFVLIFKAA